MREERGHNWVTHARRNKNGVIGGDNSISDPQVVTQVDRPSE